LELVLLELLAWLAWELLFDDDELDCANAAPGKSNAAEKIAVINFMDSSSVWESLDIRRDADRKCAGGAQGPLQEQAYTDLSECW
jgi:hypothetical protein